MEKDSVFTKAYWLSAARVFTKTKTLVFAALICALRIVVKAFKIPIVPGVLTLTFDAYVNALGSLVYGPLMGLMVGAVSDTIGALLFPSGAYFFPFIFVEMSSSFIFGLFFWRRKLSVSRVILAKFTVSFFCNIILTSLVMKWMYAYFATGKTYSLINLVRIAKNLVLFPIEGVLIVLVLNAFLPLLKSLKFVDDGQEGLELNKKTVLTIAGVTLLSVAIILFYVFFLRGYLADHNIKLF